MRRISVWPLAAASFVCLAASLAPIQAQAVQISGLGFTEHTHGGFTSTPIAVESPFFTTLRDTAASPAIDYVAAPASGLKGSIKTPNGPGTDPTGPSTTVSGRVSILGNATSAGVDATPGTADDWMNGNTIPLGVTLSFDVSFTITSTNGNRLVATTGNTSNGLGVANNATTNSGTLDSGEGLTFSAITTSNHEWSGAPTEAFAFTPVSFGVTKFRSFRSFNFDETINEGVTLSDGTNTWGFGASTGTVQSNIKMENDFSAAFTPAGGDVPLTLTVDANTSFGLKGFQLSTPVVYDIVANAPTLDADFNGDGLVDGADFLMWQQNFGVSEGAEQAQGDADGNGAINDLDLAAWQQNYGATTTPPPVSTVPEPAAAALAAIAGLSTLAFRKRR